MQTFAQIAHGIKWNYIYMMTDILTYTHSILGSLTYTDIDRHIYG